MSETPQLETAKEEVQNTSIKLFEKLHKSNFPHLSCIGAILFPPEQYRLRPHNLLYLLLVSGSSR